MLYIDSAMSREKDILFMRRALGLAAMAAANGEVPVGALVVKNGEIIAEGCNARERGHDATAHAEIEAIRSASKSLGRWRLEDCVLYVTLEPCPMCAGAIINARIPRVVYGAKDPKGGAFDSIINLRAYPLCAKPSVESGVLARESAALLADFFFQKRNPKK